MADKIKTFRELNLADDFLFGKVMSDTEICRRILEKILNIPIKKVEFPVTRKTTDTAPDDRGIRLDACINDEQGTIYSIEMQCCGKGELSRKSRSFQCNIDSDVISCGESCTKLKKSYIIFICTFDLFSDGRHIYTFENRCLEDLCLDVTDDTKIIPCTTAFSTLHSLFILFTHSTRCTKYSSQSVGNADKSRNNTCPAFVSFKWIINEVLYVIFHPLWPQQSPAGTPAQIRHTWYR